MRARPGPPSAPDLPLVEMAERGQAVEVILVLRGRIRRASDGRRCWMRAQEGYVVAFAADWVVAATPIPARAGPGRG